MASISKSYSAIGAVCVIRRVALASTKSSINGTSSRSSGCTNVDVGPPGEGGAGARPLLFPQERQEFVGHGELLLQLCPARVCFRDKGSQFTANVRIDNSRAAIRAERVDDAQ